MTLVGTTSHANCSVVLDTTLSISTRVVRLNGLLGTLSSQLCTAPRTVVDVWVFAEMVDSSAVAPRFILVNLHKVVSKVVVPYVYFIPTQTIQETAYAEHSKPPQIRS
jgi:hypothetical protein